MAGGGLRLLWYLLRRCHVENVINRWFVDGGVVLLVTLTATCSFPSWSVNMLGELHCGTMLEEQCYHGLVNLYMLYVNHLSWALGLYMSDMRAMQFIYHTWRRHGTLYTWWSARPQKNALSETVWQNSWWIANINIMCLSWLGDLDKPHRDSGGGLDGISVCL